MKDMALASRRAVESLVDMNALLVLFASGALWALINLWTWGLFIGPALVALFRIALKGLRREHAELRDNVDVLKDPAVPLVAGILFVLPFSLWVMVLRTATSLQDVARVVAKVAPAEIQSSISDITVGGVPFFATLTVFVHFAFHVLAFPVLAERRCGLVEASRAAHELAERRSGQGRLQGLPRQMLFTGIILLVSMAAWLAGRSSAVGTFVLGLVATFFVAVLAAWYQIVSGERPQEPVEPDVA